MAARRGRAACAREAPALPDAARSRCTPQRAALPVARRRALACAARPPPWRWAPRGRTVAPARRLVGAVAAQAQARAPEDAQAARLRRKLDARGLLRPVSSPTAVRTALSRGAWFELDEAYLAPDEADRLLATLLEGEPWNQVVCQAWDPTARELKRVPQPRLSSHLGDLDYRYSGQTLEARRVDGSPSAIALAACMADVNERLQLGEGERFNHCVLNLYRDGNDEIGWHADDEPQLGRQPLVAALSLGARRDFHIKRRGSRNRRPSRVVPLRHGSLLVCGGTFQHTHLHSVPRHLSAVGTRINVTFRRIAAPPFSPT